MKCLDCGESLQESLLFAMMVDAGARASWNPSECHPGKKHRFGLPETKQ